jgi:hypothetical protein
MKVLELFAGSCSFTKTAWELNKAKIEMGLWNADFYNTFTTDYKQNPDNSIDFVVDIFDFKYKDLPSIDIIWASPPCTFFSVSSIGHHWNKDHTPKTKEAEYGMAIVEKTIEIIDYLGPQFFFIENPRGKLRKLDIMKDIPRKTVTYCQYGENRMKPTDIWTNLDWEPKPMCKNGDSCHESAPRGSRTGTQGMKNAYEKSKVPHELCKELLLLSHKSLI